MSERERYPAGVPCWVETLQWDAQAALDFYGPLFGWEFIGPALMPGEPPGEYFVARVRGRDVAGIGSLRDPSRAREPTWSTYVRVDSAEETVEKAKKAGGSIREGPFDVPPAGRMAVLVDPAGATLCIWEARGREGAQLVNEPGTWAMSSLHTSDPQGSMAFYGAVFGWQSEPFGAAGVPMTLWRLPGYVGGEAEQPVPRDLVAVMLPIAAGPPSARQPHWSVDFWVDNTDAMAERAATLGGAVEVPPRDVPGFRNAVLADAQGAVFSVSQLTAGVRS
jgi:uncharacterized protein